jgi:phage tail-like protein
MANSRVLDYMQAYQFWLTDISFPTPVLLPVFGFSAITAPEITVETHDIREGTWHFPRTVVTRAAVNSITLTRGVQFFDSDFWRWIVAALSGDKAALTKQNSGALPALLAAGAGSSVRKNLLLVHFTSMNPVGSVALGTQYTRIPGKAWVLHGCVPTRYKVGSDFDASSSAISLQELEIKPEYWEEYAIGA